MAKFQVKAPVAGYNATVGDVAGGIVFKDSVAVVDDQVHATALDYFRGAGYTVEEIVDEPAAPAGTGEQDDGDQPPTVDVDGDGVPETLPRRSASTDEWRAFATAHGMSADEAATLSRDELAARYYANQEAK